MAGNTNFPTALDDNSSLLDVTDGVSSVLASHHNNTKEAVKAIEAKLGIFNTASPTSIDYRLGDVVGGHAHNGASGQGPKITRANIDITADPFTHIVTMRKEATAIVGSNVAAPMIMGRTMQLLSVQGALRRGPSGATTAFDINLNQPTPVSIWAASQGNQIVFPPGATAFRSAATPNTITYPSGAIVTMDVDAVGSSEPGQDLTITFIFRD